MPCDRREAAALRNLGQVMLDPTLGFCEPLATQPALAGGRAAPGESDAWRAWAPLFDDMWVPKPVRAFFRRVSLSLDENEPNERTVSPETQSWMVLALSQAVRRFEHGDAVWRELGATFSELAFRAGHFTADQLTTDAGLVAARQYAYLDGSAPDRSEPLAYPQGLWLEALAVLHAALQAGSADRAAQVRGWAAAHAGAVVEWLAAHEWPRLPAAAKARLLQGLAAVQAIPSLYVEARDGWSWTLIADLVDSQDETGSWEGSLRGTAETLSALSHAGRYDLAAVYPDALGRAIAWLQRMQRAGRSLPAPMEGLRVWEYSLDDVGALLEASRLGARALLHPADADTLAVLGRRWWGAALGRRSRLPDSPKYGGQWVAGFRYLKDRKAWFRDLRIEPGPIARVAYEAFALNSELPEASLQDAGNAA